MAQSKIDLKQAGAPHPYHLVNPSPWPIISAFSAGTAALGAAMYFNAKANAPDEPYFPTMLVMGLLGIVAMMVVWWRDVIREHVVERAHSAIANIGFRYGMALFIASEVMFFVAFFWGFLSPALFPNEAISGVWPPAGVETVAWYGLPLLMTMILLLSGQTVTWAHAAILRNDRRTAVRALAITVALGTLFLFVQITEYGHATFNLWDGNIYPSAFYMATGFHGFHVFVGTVFLFICLIRQIRGHFTPDDHFGFEAAAWYWHFVDVVWLFLFVVVYIWGS